MKYILYVLFTLSSFSLFAQVTTDPDIAIDTKSVKIIFDATQGSEGLKGHTGDVYAHTGVLTQESGTSSEWKYVIADWEVNTEKAKLTKIGDDLYELDITPSIREFYGVDASDDVLQMAFVFRSEDGNKTGKTSSGGDIFVDVFTEGLIVQFTDPTGDKILEPGANLPISISSTETADLTINVDGAQLNSGNGTTLSSDYTFSSGGDYWLWASASTGSETVYDSVFVHVKSPVENVPMPANYRPGINYLSDNSVALVLWAPEKEYVYAIGDFSDWKPKSDYQMKKDGHNHWIEIESVQKGKPYIYQYLIDGELKIADPYTDQISDPWNDKWISEETYPGLVQYPEGKTEGIASVFTTGQEDYQWEVTDFQIPNTDNLVIYELLIRDFDSLHTYQAVIDRLDYLEDLNINVLELMPVNEFEGNSSWGYNPSFYFAADKYYGHKNNLKKLVDECHKRGIAVLIDMVLNHSFNQSPLAQMYWNSEMGRPAANNPWYNEQHNLVDNTAAHWGNDFDHESQATKDFIDSVNIYWLTEYNVDGFRFDFTKGFSNTIYTGSNNWASDYDADRIANLKRMSDKIWEVKPDAIVSFEHLSENSEEKELADYGILLWGNMNHNYAEGAMGYNESGKSNLSGALHTSRGFSEPMLIAYQESHDEERVAYKCLMYGDSVENYSTKNVATYTKRLELNNLFLTLFPGPKMQWMFGELAYDISIDENGRTGEKPIKWDYVDNRNRYRLYTVVANINHLKTTYDEFGDADIVTDLSSELKKYTISKNNKHIVAAGNYSLESKTVDVDFPVTGTWYNYFERSSMDVSSSSVSITLKPGEYVLYSTEEYDMPIEIPQIITGIDPVKDLDLLTIYPNPGINYITLDKANVKNVQIIEINGKLVKSLDIESAGNELVMDVSDLRKGLYVLKVTDNKNMVHKTKFLKE